MKTPSSQKKSGITTKKTRIKTQSFEESTIRENIHEKERKNCQILTRTKENLEELHACGKSNALKKNIENGNSR